MKQKGFTLVELIIVIAILGIIALIAVPNLAGIRQRSQVAADKRTAEQIGKAVRIWETDIGKDNLPTTPTKYDEIEGLCPTYISSDFIAKSYEDTEGTYYVCAVGEGDNKKIVVGVGNAEACDLTTPSEPVEITYVGGESGWAYCEGTDYVIPGSAVAIKANTEVKVGDFIAYTGGGYTGKWVVIRNTGGVIEIISKEGIGGVTLSGANGYSNCVKILNDKCATYVNSTYATSGRSVGATSSSIGEIDTTQYPLTFAAARSAVLPYYDTYCSSDTNIIHGNDNLKHSSGLVWLASRDLTTDSGTSIFNVRNLETSGSVTSYYLVYAFSNGSISTRSFSRGVRPVITLKSNIKITGGTGESDNPYTIGI
ncbi:MAG: prepilin-type N-terminal cleavage/methylation domain-containing protein [Clostridia bacterium]|nr:prepilin-type N-terminal cleavage/methylation domain-containing protein [Clostridia bacterium]